MRDKISLKELECYQRLSDEEKAHKLISPDRYFNLDKIKSAALARELEGFIIERGKRLSALSMRGEFTPFNQLCEVVNEEFSAATSFLDIGRAVVERAAKKWLMKHGKPLIRKHVDYATGYQKTDDVGLLSFIKHLYEYLDPEEHTFNFESDRWFLEDAPMEIRKDPVKNRESISFEKIPQLEIKNEIKQAVYIRLSRKALNTVAADLTAVNRFCGWLYETYPEVESLLELDREIFEDYLVYINTEASERKTYDKDLSHLKSVFCVAGKILEEKDLENLIIPDDISSAPTRFGKVYSETEQERLNEAIARIENVQVARALMMHELLGTRMSDALTLKQNAIFQGEDGTWKIRIDQVKSRKSFTKVINDDIKRLFEAACDHTREHFGEREYVFVNERDPDKALPYSVLQYHLMDLIQRNDLRDDNGELFHIDTHAWRRCYGTCLTELGIDDLIIAKLLGHANTSNLRAYRRVRDPILADETRGVRTNIDKQIRDALNEQQEESG